MGIQQDSIKNRTIYCKDNLDILRGINTQSIDLIYLDPPFNKKKTFTAPIGSSAEGAEFADIFREEDVKDEWLDTIEEDNENIFGFLNGIKSIEGRTSYNFCYLSYMAIRLIECHRVLKDTGSLYLHCDTTMSHYLKILLDCIFGERQFKNEVVWCYDRWDAKSKDFQRMHDSILRYSKSEEYIFNEMTEVDDKRKITLDRGYTTNLLKDGSRQLIIYKGNENRKNIKNLMKKSKFDNVIIKEPTGRPLKDYWNINFIHPKSKERTGYPTQKPLALLERIINASSNKGDVVLDPFCGCATTCVAAEKLERQWIGVDISQKAYELVKQRLANEVEWVDSLFEEELVTFKVSAPKRTDQEADYREKKWVYVISNPAPSFEGSYKVGIAKDWKRRLNSYQTSDPDRAYKIEYRIETHDFKQLEAHIHNHEKFDNRHEWVYGELDDIIKAIEKFVGEKGIKGNGNGRKEKK